jgi:glycosyltransferase involved in cell wall biosynthesis
VRLFGIMIANGFSSEVRVGSQLLGGAPNVDATLTVHRWGGDQTTPEKVEAESKAQISSMDFGWRPNPDATRPRWEVAASWAKLLSTIPELILRAKRANPDAIWSSQQKWDCTAASLVAAALRKPQIVHLYYVPGPWLGVVAQRRLKTATGVIACSAYTRERALLHGTPAARAFTVPNPVPLHPKPKAGTREAVRSELGLAPTARVLGCIARLSPTKAQPETIAAFGRIASACPTAQLVLVGDGSIRSELEAQAASLGLSKRIHFTGARGDLPALMEAFDIFVHPSYEDPLPLAVLEAQAAGLPVLAFADGGLPEIVVNEETGLLSPTRDVAALARDMQRLIDDPELGRRFGEAGTRRVLSVFASQRSSDAFSKAVHAIAGL